MMSVRQRFNRILLGVITMGISAVMLGTLLWFIWEDSLSAMFPTAVASGILAAKLTWTQAVKISWVFNILFKQLPEARINKKGVEEEKIPDQKQILD